MKIGIFGDSFTDNKNGGDPIYQETAWPQLLANKFDVTNYGMAGSGLEFSLDQIYHHADEFDKIIFVSTSPQRMMINEEHRHKLLNDDHDDMRLHHHLRPADSSGRKVNGKDDKFYNRCLTVAQEYSDLFVNNDHLDQRVALVWKALKAHYGNKLLLLYMAVPEVGGYIGQKYLRRYNIWPDNEMSLYDICDYENDFIFGSNTYEYEYDRRSCHITHWHHNMLYEKMVHWAWTGKFSLTQRDLVDLKLDEVYSMYYGREWNDQIF